MDVKVVATARGYIYNRIIEEGEQFILTDRKYTDRQGNVKTLSAADQFSKVWMRRAEGKKKAAPQQTAERPS